MTKQAFGFSTRAIHDGQHPDPSTGAVMTPIYQTSTYAQPSPGTPVNGYEYSRTQNPTRKALEENLASLENAKFAMCFSSGLAALSAVLHTLSSGDHVIVCDDVYGGTFRSFDKVYKQFGIAYSCVDLLDANALNASFQSNTRLLWIETPTNPMLKIIDIEQVCVEARKRRVISVVDNTFATPYLQTPLDLGADLVCHSTTKYLGGHTDVVGGALMTNDNALNEKLRFVQNAVGAVPGPMDSYLTLRSTKTLALRMERHCANAQAVAEYLSNHPAVERVIYPGLPSHPQHAIARKQMRDFGGMITAVLKGDLPFAKRFLENLALFYVAESLGGVESLIEHPAIMTHASVPPEQRQALGISDGLVRLSIGVEDVSDLLTDIEEALDKAK